MTMLNITVIGQTKFDTMAAGIAVYERSDVEVTWHDETGQSLGEFAGRACYDSWGRPNPDTATLEGYLGHIIEVEHESVLEHGSVSVYIEGASRSFTHELVRHRHFSYSQLSQRFVVLKAGADEEPQTEVPVPGAEPYVVPPLFDGDYVAGTILWEAWKNAVASYDQLLERADQILGEGVDSTERKKRAREAARAVLPNMTPTAIVVTGNHRAWREAILKRATVHADAEICAIFVGITYRLKRLFPAIYQDMHVTSSGDREIVCNCKDNEGAMR